MYLFDSKLAVATIRNYRSALAAIHKGFADGSSITTSDAITHLIRGMFVDRPPTRKLLPSWDLPQVIAILSKAPYEPLEKASLLDLSVKLAFLLAVATVRRRSELHALTIQPGHIRWEPGGVRLIPDHSFLTKNQTPSFAPPDIFVPTIKSFSSIPEDKLWCPVRALKWYIDRTKTLRGNCHKLFITTTRPYRPASKDTVSRWIVTAIRSTIDGWPNSPGQTPHAHDVRAVSASWAFFRGVPMREILQAACWKSPTTFTSCYLRDVLQTEGRPGRTTLLSAGRAAKQ